MATVNLPRQRFEKEIGTLTEEMQQKIALFGTTVESLSEETVEIDVAPNRPDLLSYQGFKRSFLGYLGKQKKIPSYSAKKPEKNYEVKIDPSVKKVRPYTRCAIVKGLKLSQDDIQELIDIQEKLHTTVGRKRKKLAIGMYPLDKITLPITFQAKEPDKIKFQPLDFERELTGIQILQRHPTGRMYAHLLAGKQVFPLFTDATGNALSMPPIINAEKTGKITLQTTEIFIECSGEEKEVLDDCLTLLVTILAEMGGTIYSMIINDKGKDITPNLTPRETRVNLNEIDKWLGLGLSEKEMILLLEKMGHSYKKGKVISPRWRGDILHEVDLAEEIAIAYGYENIVPQIPTIATIGEQSKKETFKKKLMEVFTTKGYLETSSVHLTRKEDQKERMGKTSKKDKGIEVLDSKTEFTLLREDLSHALLRILSENGDNEYPQAIVEAGTIFTKSKKEIIEEEHLAYARAPGNFTQIKQDLLSLAAMIGVSFEIKEAKETPEHLIEGRVAEIYYEKKRLGTIGEVHPKILKKWKIKMPVALAEFEITPLLKKNE